MKTQLLGAGVVVGALLCVGASPAVAQTDQVSAKVPFSFVIGRVSLPAGTYHIIANSANPEVMAVTNADGTAGATILTGLTGAPSTEETAALIFRKVDGKYYLAAIQIPGEDVRDVVLPEVPEPASARHES